MNEVICPNGHRNRAGAKFCSVCQSPIPKSTAPASPQKGPAAKLPRQWLWIALAILSGLIIVSLIAAFWLLRDDGPDESTAIPAGATTVESVETAPEVLEATATAMVTAAESLATAVVEAPATATAVLVESTVTDVPTPESIAVDVPTIEGVVLVSNLLTNGDFSQNWNVGWKREIGANTNGPQRTEVIDEVRALSGKALQISRSGAGILQLQQNVNIGPGPLRFQAQVKLDGSDDTGGAEGLAALMLVYHGADLTQPPLGYSIWANGSQRETDLFGQSSLPPIGPNTSVRWHGDEWKSIDIDIRQEIVNALPRVNPDEVRQISVVLLGTGSEICQPDGCTAGLIASDLILSQ